MTKRLAPERSGDCQPKAARRVSAAKQKGTFFWPRAAESGQAGLKLAPEAFALLTDGIDMHRAKPRGWYQRE